MWPEGGADCEGAAGAAPPGGARCGETEAQRGHGRLHPANAGNGGVIGAAGDLGHCRVQPVAEHRFVNQT